jgi:hypothetical protein
MKTFLLVVYFLPFANLLIIIFFVCVLDRFLGIVEYIETFNAGTEESFDVNITGEWMLNMDRNPYTGQPATVIKVDPLKMVYGAASQFMASDDAPPVVQVGGGFSQTASWQSFGPIKLLDIIYLTEDLQITRGNSNMEAIFVSKKCK